MAGTSAAMFGTRGVPSVRKASALDTSARDYDSILMKRARSFLMNGRDASPSRPFGLSSQAARPAVAPYLAITLVIGVWFSAGCSRKPAQTAPPPPEVLVTTVTPKDVPRVLERVATLDGFINANINAQVQGYIVSRDYQEGSVVKKGDLLFQIDPRPFEAALAQAKGTLAKDKANQVKADADEKRAMDLFNKESDQRPGARYSHRRRPGGQSKHRSRRSGGETGGDQSRLHENYRPD